MRYIMKQKILAWGDDFILRDEAGNDAFIVDGKVFSWGDKLSVQEAATGREVAFISQKMFNWGPTYEISRDGRVAAVVKKQLFTFFNCRFFVDVPGPNDIEAAGDFLDHEYSFQRDGHSIAHVSKKWFHFTDTYGIDIAQGEDDVLLLACAVVIDMVCHGDKKKH